MSTTEELVKRAERGQHRGAESVWSDAAATGIAVQPAKNVRPLWMAAAAVAVPIAVVAGAIVWRMSGDEAPDTVLVGDSPDATEAAPLDFTDAEWEVLPDPDGVFEDAGLTREVTVTGPVEYFSEAELERQAIDSSISIRSIAKTSSGFIAVGAEQQRRNVIAAVWESVDGRSWKRVYDEMAFGHFDEESSNISPSGWSMEYVAERNGTIVAAGSENSDSSNPVAWVKHNDADWKRLDQALTGWTGFSVKNLIATPDGFLLIGTDSSGPGSYRNADSAYSTLLWRSADGEKWTPIDAAQLGENALVSAAISHRDELVMVGSTGAFRGKAAAWTSIDGGETWTRARFPALADPLPFSSLRYVARGTDGYLALGDYQTGDGFSTGRSTDGSGETSTSGDANLGAWASPDGHTWTSVPVAGFDHPDKGEYPTGLVHGPGGFVFAALEISAESLFESKTFSIYDMANGIELRQLSQQGDRRITDLIATDNGYLAAGTEDRISAILSLEPQ